MEAQNDIDLIVNKKDVPLIIACIRAWPGLNLVGIHHTTNTVQLYIDGISQGESRFLCLDLQTQLTYAALPYMHSNAILLRREAAVCGIGYQPQPLDLALIYLFTHVLRHKRYDADVQHVIQSGFKADRGALIDTLHDYFGDDVSKVIHNLFHSEPRHAIKSLKYRFILHNLKTHGLVWPFSWLKEKLIILKRRLLDKQDVRIVVLGTDGAGKTTLIRHMLPMLRNARPAVIHAHLLPVLPWQKEPNSGLTNPSPHQQPNRHWVMSNLKLVYYFGLYWLDALWPYRGSRVIIYDRHMVDVTVDPKRFRFGGSMGFARFIIRYLPRIDLYVWVNTPPAIAFQRKPELPLNIMAEQYQGYHDLIKTLPNSFTYTSPSVTPTMIVDQLSGQLASSC